MAHNEILTGLKNPTKVGGIPYAGQMAHSIVDIDPRMIDNAGFKDRLDGESDLPELAQSIRDYGQQVPVLLRPNPNDAERYEIVYGRRRVAALRLLGHPVRAMVCILDDAALVMAQGQENAARKELTFIEKANFARQMHIAGYTRAVICAALHMDKTLISRMLSVAERLPVELIEAIGPAPGIGRDRWLALAEIANADAVELAQGTNSDARFEAVMQGLNHTKSKPKKNKALKPDILRATTGLEIARFSRQRGKVVFEIKTESANGFDDWLIDNMADIHRNWEGP